MEMESRIARLEERQQALERDVKEIKQQLYRECKKKTDVERLEKILNERDTTPNQNMWRLILQVLIGETVYCDHNGGGRFKHGRD